MKDNFLADEVFDTEYGIKVLKNRELDGETAKGKLKTTFRCVELELSGMVTSRTKEMLVMVYKHFKKSIGKAYINSQDEFIDSIISGFRTPIMVEIKSELVFENSYNSVVNFFKKHPIESLELEAV